MNDVLKHGTHDQKTHAGGRGKGGAGAASSGARNASGKPLTPSQDKKLNDLSVEMFNHKQNVPMSVRTGNMNSPQAKTHIQRGQQIVTQAQDIFGGSREETMSELNRRMGG